LRCRTVGGRSQRFVIKQIATSRCASNTYLAETEKLNEIKQVTITPAKSINSEKSRFENAKESNTSKNEEKNRSNKSWSLLAKFGVEATWHPLPPEP
jgi:hypothetical protein